MKMLKIVLVIVAVSFFSPSFATEGNFFGQVGEFLENLDVEFTITAPVVQHQTNQHPVIQRPVAVPCNRGNGRGNGRGNCNRPNTVVIPRAPVVQQPRQVLVPVVVPRTIVQQPVYTPVQQPVYTQPVYTQPVQTQPVYTPVQQPVTYTSTTTTSTANSGYNGYASYQDYLDSFYSQNGGSAYTGSTSSTTASNCNCTPAQTTHTASSGYQGYASYQDYLDNYYTQENSNTSTYTSQPTHTTTQVTSSASGYQGYASYDDYLAAYYAQDASSTSYEATQPTYTSTATHSPTPTIHTDTSDTYMGYASYQDYLDHYHSSSASSSSSSYGSGYVDSSTSYVASAQISTTPIHVPAPVVHAAPVTPTVVGYSASTSISYSHLPTGYFNLGYDQGYIIGNNTRMNLVDIERASGGHNVLVLRVVQNNQPRQVRVNLAQGRHTTLEIGGKQLRVEGLEQVNNRNVVRCYFVN